MALGWHCSRLPCSVHIGLRSLLGHLGTGFVEPKAGGIAAAWAATRPEREAVFRPLFWPRENIFHLGGARKAAAFFGWFPAGIRILVAEIRKCSIMYVKKDRPEPGASCGVKGAGLDWVFLSLLAADGVCFLCRFFAPATAVVQSFRLRF